MAPINKTSHGIQRGYRVEQLRKMTGFKAKELAEALDLSKATISYWENGGGTSGGITRNGVTRLLEFARKHNVICDHEWLWSGIGEEPYYAESQKFLENAQKSSEIIEFISSLEKETKMFLSKNEKAILLKVENDDMYPYLERGDIVGGVWKPIESLHGEKNCIVDIDGSKEIKRIRIDDKKNKIFVLNPKNNTVDVLKITLTEVAPISRIWKLD